jgi:hypothetical protein
MKTDKPRVKAQPIKMQGFPTFYYEVDYNELFAAVEQLEAKLKIARECIEYYANHKSVIDSVTQDDKKNIRVVHTFISNRAIVTLKKLED